MASFHHKQCSLLLLLLFVFSMQREHLAGCFKCSWSLILFDEMLGNRIPMRLYIPEFSFAHNGWFQFIFFLSLFFSYLFLPFVLVSLFVFAHLFDFFWFYLPPLFVDFIFHRLFVNLSVFVCTLTKYFYL